MDKSPNIGLNLTPSSDNTKKFKEFRTELAGDGADSNMMIIDTEVGEIKNRCETLETTPITWGMLKNGFRKQTT